MTTTIVKPEIDTSIIEQSAFLQELVLQVRARDHHNIYRSCQDELILANYLITKDKKNQILVKRDVDSLTELKIFCFYQAIASGIEKQTGKFSQVVMSLSPEGFGKASIWTGPLIVLSRTLKNAQYFGYPSLKRLASQGETLVNFGIKTSDLLAITNI
jgi:probable nitrogen fixation protein